MPRATEPRNEKQLARILIVGDGKCGKSEWAARAAESGFNVLYIDGDVGAQTIATLPREIRERIFILSVHDKLTRSGMNHAMVDFVKDFFSNRGTILWNDSQSRPWSRISDGDSTEDEVWEITPMNLDHTWVVVLDSWTALSYSAMKWAAEEVNVELGEIDTEARRKMRDVYQPAGEKLTAYLDVIQKTPFHWVVIAHPTEFTKTEKPTGVTVKGAKEGDHKILWTKMVPKSSSNNHAFTMPKYFTDLAWLEVSVTGEYTIDFRPSNSRLSGSHLNAILKSRGEGSFGSVVEKIGGITPKAPSDWTKVIQIHNGYTAPNAKPKVEKVLDGEATVNAPAIKGKALGFAAFQKK